MNRKVIKTRIVVANLTDCDRAWVGCPKREKRLNHKLVASHRLESQVMENKCRWTEKITSEMKMDEMKCRIVIRFLIGLVSIRDLVNLGDFINVHPEAEIIR